VYAMGGDPITALNIVAFPRGALDLEILADVLKGGGERVRAAGAVVLGGHSIIDPELKYGMAVTGVVHPDRVIRNIGVKAGDVLVLTKPLGTGIVTTALKQRNASRASVRAAVASMVALNRAASLIARTFPVHACSDVTGFGLLGHAAEMAMGSGIAIVLDAAALPVLPGALRMAEKGFLTGGCQRNRAWLADKVIVDRTVRAAHEEVAFDPQTSGGLLIALPEKAGAALVRKLRAKGMETAAIVGRAYPKRDAWVYLT
jgi:selenide,water dikinase